MLIFVLFKGSSRTSADQELVAKDY